jgi:hypothetical protein
MYYSNSNIELFVNDDGMVKLYNFSGDGLKKLNPLSNTFLTFTLLVDTLSAPTNVVLSVKTTLC